MNYPHDHQVIIIICNIYTCQMTTSSQRPQASTQSQSYSLSSIPGGSTLSSALSWTLHRLSSDPDVRPAALNEKHRPHTPTPRRASPFTPPPLVPLQLTGYSTSTTSRLLSRALAEEIRLLLPPRLQLHDTWSLAYSLEQHGVSLATLYAHAASYPKGGFVIVVKDSAGGIFGAFINEPPRPSGRYYGTGECFLWKATILPLPPHSKQQHSLIDIEDPVDRTSTPDQQERIRFKAFPYSGINDYMIYCDTRFISVGGGDGKYGLWLDDVFEKGVSSPCQTFGNEPLAEEGQKFEIMDVELWSVGA